MYLQSFSLNTAVKSFHIIEKHVIARKLVVRGLRSLSFMISTVLAFIINFNCVRSMQ